MLKTKIKNSLVTLIVLFSVIACDDKRIFDEYKTVENSSWGKGEKMSFSFVVDDTIARRNLFINLRNNDDYEFSNLFLITKLNCPDGTKIIDTLEYAMTSNSGEFYGQGFAEIKENKLFYKENIKFPDQGAYIFSVEQVMRKNGDVNALPSLKGITEVGFRIEK